MKHKYTSADLTEHQIQACVMKRATGNPAKAQLEMMPDEGKQDSPRLRWMKRHGVYAYQCDRGFYVSVFNGLPSSRTHFEPTEIEALEYWAKRNNIPLWNEDEFAGGGK